MLQTKAKLIKNIEVTKNYYKIIISCPRLARLARPGQFLQVKVADADEPLLRRPFSIHRVSCQLSAVSCQQGIIDKKPNAIEILYEVVGRATEILARRKSGEYLDVIGPLGQGFDYRTAYGVPRTALLVAGGMGVAPLFFLADKLCERNTQYARRPPSPRLRRTVRRSFNEGGRNTLVLIGARTKNQILCEKEFQELGCEVKIATDDGSRGFKGKATDLLEKQLSAVSCQLSAIYACGPRPMLKAVAAVSAKYHIPAQISLEEHMACGIGACLGCVVKTRDEGRGTRDEFRYKRVCKEGPVFNADEIVWE